LEENFDRFNFEIHKEKEMVSFRRCMLALTVLVLFAGLASAQVGAINPLTCGTNVSVTPTLRSEGYTEQTGDITLTCTGGVSPATGTQIPAVNIQVFLNTAVTSRLLPISNLTNTSSEALLLIDEPGSGLAGYGPSLAQKVCPNPVTGCTQFVGNVPGATLGTAVDACASFNVATGACANTSAVFGANVFQGIVTGNSVTFFGVPVLPPVTAGSARVYRITNVRANATSLSGGAAAGATPVIASISISGATSLSITNPTPTVGFVQSGLTSTASGASNLNQCNNATRSSLSTLTFTENFGTAFKTRVAAQTNTIYSGQINNPVQNIPGQLYQSESNFVLAVPGNSTTAGLADYGTRLKASFNNIPAGIRLFVSTVNVQNNALPFVNSVPGASSGNTGTSPFAQLVTSETVNDGNAGISGFFPTVSSTDVPSTGNTPIVEIPVVNGSASAVWEVVNTNPNAIETIRFGVYTTYSANVPQNSPPPGTGTVNLSFAPTPTAAFTASAGAAASSTLTIPRFIADTSTARNLFNINICRTVLLYPYVTNISGFDSGLAVSNTSTDPFGTGAQAGTCDLNWYQGANNPAVITTPVIPSGTVYTTLASTAVPGFNGYMIAVCKFQYAHGFAFISDLGARNFASIYLALVIPDPATNSSGRVASPLSTGAGGSGENIGH
jgi:hypothetical protein